MKKTIITLLICLPLLGIAQMKMPFEDKIHLDSTKTSCKITMYSTENYLYLMRNYKDSVKKVVMYPNRYDKKLRSRYYEYVIYFPRVMFTKLNTFIAQL